jgi:hypothetical protein
VAAAIKPKKEYLTAKKLEDNIAGLDAQIKTANGGKPSYKERSHLRADRAKMSLR